MTAAVPRRPTTVSFRLIAGGSALYGLLALLAPSIAYSSPTYTVVFDLAAHIGPPLRVWGAMFLISGLVAFVAVEVGRFLLIGTITSWALGLWTAVISGQAATWGGPIWPSLVAMLILLNTGRSTVR